MRYAPFLVIASLLFSQAVFAVSSSEQRVEGYVLSFSAKTISIESGSSKLTIPRAMYPYKVKIGEKISVKVDEANLQKIKSKKIKK